MDPLDLTIPAPKGPGDTIARGFFLGAAQEQFKDNPIGMVRFVQDMHRQSGSYINVLRNLASMTEQTEQPQETKK